MNSYETQCAEKLRKRNLEKLKRMINVLVTQRSKWIAGRMRRALLGQAAFAGTRGASKQLLLKDRHRRQESRTKRLATVRFSASYSSRRVFFLSLYTLIIFNNFIFYTFFNFPTPSKK